MLKKLPAIGRILFLVSFSFYVFLHFGLPEVGVTTYVPTYLPFPYFWNYLTGVCILTFIVSGLIGKFDKLAALSMAVYLLCVALMIHLPKAADPMELLNVFRVVNMIGGALMYAGAFSKDTRLWFTARKPVMSRSAAAAD